MKKKELLIPKWLFDETKSVVIRLPYANGKVRSNVIWNTHKIQSLFNNNDKIQHLSCVIYKGVCFCGTDYIGEIICNVKIRWNEHVSGLDKNS